MEPEILREKVLVHYQYKGQEATGYCQSREAWIAMWQCAELADGIEAMYIEDGLEYFLDRVAEGSFIRHVHTFEEARRCRCGLATV